MDQRGAVSTRTQLLHVAARAGGATIGDLTRRPAKADEPKLEPEPERFGKGGMVRRFGCRVGRGGFRGHFWSCRCSASKHSPPRRKSS